MVVPSQAQTYTTLFNFEGTNGSKPSSPLVQGLDGQLYGSHDVRREQRQLFRNRRLWHAVQDHNRWRVNDVVRLLPGVAMPARPPPLAAQSFRTQTETSSGQRRSEVSRSGAKFSGSLPAAPPSSRFTVFAPRAIAPTVPCPGGSCWPRVGTSTELLIRVAPTGREQSSKSLSGAR